MRMAFLCPAAIVACIGGGCGFGRPAVFIDVFSLLEVDDAQTGQPISGAEVKVAGIVTGRHGNVEDTAVRLAPTDESGQTLVPVSSLEERASQVVLHVSLQSGAASEMLDVDWRDGASATGDHFTIRVVQMQSAPPPTPIPSVVEGTNPPLIEINGYITGLGVCLNATGEVIWSISSHRFGAYVDAVSLGDLPDGFYESTNIPGPKVIPRDQLASSEGYTAFAVPVFFAAEDYVLSAPYCLADDGAVQPCGN